MLPWGAMRSKRSPYEAPSVASASPCPWMSAIMRGPPTFLTNHWSRQSAPWTFFGTFGVVVEGCYTLAALGFTRGGRPHTDCCAASKAHDSTIGDRL
jgi:hypothetical protein